MVMLKREEALFAEGVVKGMSPAKAAKAAGYRGNGMAGKLLKRAHVQARIAELGEAVDVLRASEVARAVVPTRDWVMRELIETVYESKAAKDRTNTYRGLELVGKEIGMFVTRTMSVDSPLQRLPASQLVQLLALIDKALPNPDALPALTAPREVTIDVTVEPSSEATDDVW